MASSALILVALLSGCAPGVTIASPTPPRGAALTSQWDTYHLDAARSGDDGGEPSFLHLRGAWTAGPLDGALYAEPLVDGGNVIVATEGDSVYDFDAVSGRQLWRVTLGTPRTSRFPCGDIKPLGITGTPVIDGGRLYVLAEVEDTPGAYRFDLANLNPSNGAILYNRDVTPRGMNTDAEQERSALAVSAGNVVITWGGLDGDCGSYHGYVETVSESSGVEAAQWNDTERDNQGGVWAPSGPAVDAAGNIYVTTGNGSTSDITQYDDGDSVLQFSPSLSLISFFAPGPPEAWPALNAADLDLGSVGPTLLSNGLLFAIGKSGRGYLLKQSGLPNNSEPGGGELASQPVCAGSRGAFSGMAAAGDIVFVPCSEGIAAVSIDSARSFRVVWRSASGSSAPIIAGGLVWTLSLFGGTRLYGLDPGTGSALVTLNLPATTAHFASPSAGDGRLFVGAGDLLRAFEPQ
jgi:outer membrane protein assembly factor BamB